MALLTRCRRAAPSEFTLNYYDKQKRLGEASTLLKSQEHPPAPRVPPLLPRDVGGAWSAPPRVNPAIWRASHQTKLHQAKSATSSSQRQREENKRLCEEVRSLTKSRLAQVNRRLEDHRADVSFWQLELDSRHVELSEDTHHLIEIRDRLEKQLDNFLHPLEVAQKCMELRNERVGIENVEDEVSTNLREEIEEIVHCRLALSRTLNDALEQIRGMRSFLYHLAKNINDKRTAMEVDKITSELTPMEPPSMIIPSQELDPSPMSVSNWRATCVNLTQKAEKDHSLAMQIITVSEALLASSARQIKEAINHTNEALNKRIEDTRDAKSKLEDEHSKIVEEEGELKSSIAELQSELEDKREPLTIAQSRLKKRQSRPIREQTRDEVEAALLQEVGELELTVERLIKALDFSRRRLQQVTSSKVSLELDINLKTKTLHLDEVQLHGLRSTVHIEQC